MESRGAETRKGHRQEKDRVFRILETYIINTINSNSRNYRVLMLVSLEYSSPIPLGSDSPLQLANLHHQPERFGDVGRECSTRPGCSPMVWGRQMFWMSRLAGWTIIHAIGCFCWTCWCWPISCGNNIESFLKKDGIQELPRWYSLAQLLAPWAQEGLLVKCFSQLGAAVTTVTILTTASDCGLRYDVVLRVLLFAGMGS